MIDSRYLLKKHEGLRLKPYIDTTGNLTVGYGHNLNQEITEVEAERLFESDYQSALKTCLSIFPRFVSLCEVRQAVLLDMAFNLGLFRLSSFVRMIGCVKDGDYNGAYNEMLDSRWAVQVGNRSTMLADMMKTGNWPKEETS